MAGLPGAGKSWLASRLADRAAAPILNKDTVREALFPGPLTDYSAQQDDHVVSILLDTALFLFKRDPSRPVILEGRTHARAYQVEMVNAFAAAHGIETRWIECVCAEQTALGRLASDIASSSHPARNRDASLYLRQRDAWQQIPPPKLVVDTEAVNWEAILSFIE